MDKNYESKTENSILPANSMYKDVLGTSVLLVLKSAQLNILGQTFRPIFCGKVVKVTNGTITLYPANIKMSNAPQYIFPTPLTFPIEHIALFTEFDCETRLPL